MSSKTGIIIVSIIVALIILSIALYYFISSGILPIKNILPGIQQEKEVPRVTQEEQDAQLAKEYPNTFTGIISFQDTDESYKTTLKTDDGKEYILWPAQPKIIYESFGAKDGAMVEIQGKLSSQINLEWTKIKLVTGN